jgi:hypothetical protein
MTNELINSVITGHPDRTYLNRSICSRRLYYQRLRLKRIIAHYQQMQCSPLELDLEVSDVG